MWFAVGAIMCGVTWLLVTGDPMLSAATTFAWWGERTVCRGRR